MLTAIGVGNFKAFAELQRIPVRPLTLIYGANSSGKSSILHSLILARHAQETGELDVHLTNVGGEAVDLGGFKKFIHRRDVGRSMEWTVELDAANITEDFAGLLSPVSHLTVSLAIGIARDNKGRPLQEASPELHTYEVLADDRKLLRMSKRQDGKLRLDQLDHEHPVFRETVISLIKSFVTNNSIRPSEIEELASVVAEIVPKIIASVGDFLPEGLAKSKGIFASGGESLFLLSQNQQKDNFAMAVRHFVPLILNGLLGGIYRAIFEELSRVLYLGPLRSYPPRHLAFSQYHDSNWFAGGGYAWDVICNDSNVSSSSK